MWGLTFDRSVVIFVRVGDPIPFVPVVHTVIVVSADTIVYDEIVLGKATLDDALVLFLGHFIVEVRVLLLDPRSATALARALELRESIEFGLFFAFRAVGHIRRRCRLGWGMLISASLRAATRHQSLRT